MAISCTPQALVTASACFNCIDVGMRGPVQTYLMAQIANTIAGTSTDPNTLSKLATCFNCLNPSQQLAVQNFLLCAIAQASGA